MNKFRSALFLLFFFSANFIYAQRILDGTVLDSDDRSELIGATVKISLLSDSTQWRGTATDIDGKFQFTDLPLGRYKISINYIGYKPHSREIEIDNSDKHLGTISLAKNATMLKEVSVTEIATRVEQRDDTSDYNANAFKTNKDASAEDLVTKMPGITSENGTIKAHGQEVKKVLVDGKEFFGDDATLALRNLPSEIVDRVQIFDRMGDQASFTGFDDGRSQKTLNIVTKSGKNNGVFGKLYAGYGYLYDSRYSAGGNINWFNGDRRLSVIGMTNNVNQQNFSMQDLVGITGSTSRGGGRAFGGGRPRSGGNRGGGGLMNSAEGNFMVGQLGGNSTTHSAGVNYSDVLGKKDNLKLTVGYFFNLTNNSNATSLSRQYFNAGDSATTYKEENSTMSQNQNHRLNLRLEYAIDSMNALIFTPKFSYQKNSQTNMIIGQNFLSEGALLNKTQSGYEANNVGYNGSADLLYQHKFKKRYRTISFNVGTTINNRFGNAAQNALNSFTASDSTMLDQETNSASTSYKLEGNISYTEPAGKTGMVQLSYEPSYTWNKSDKETFNRDTALQTYSALDTLLSNKYDNDYMTHKATASYRVKGEKNGETYNITVGVAGQYALLTGVSIFPYSYNTNRAFYNLLPNAMFNYQFKNKSSLRVMYRASTNPPSISQLQSVIDNSNPLLLSSGNPNLKQSYSHFVLTHYRYTNVKNAQTFFAFASVNYTHNNVANSTFIATHDTMLNGDVLLRAGSQLKTPVNINGTWNANSFFTYGIPITKIKSNFNLNAGFSYFRAPGLINNALNVSNTYGVNGGFMLSSNINEKIDFSIGYSANYNIVKNTLQTKSDNNYFTHNATARLNWQFWKGFVFNTTLQNTLYTGIASGFNQNIFLWNAALAYKFLKDESLELRVSANDILNQNSGISRTITDTYIEDSRTQVLRRYLLVTVTYTLKYFKNSDTKNERKPVAP